METITIPIVKQNTEAKFLTALGIPHGSTDAYRLMKACRNLYTINQAGNGAGWESDLRKAFKEVIEEIAKRYELYVIFETNKDQAPVKFAHKLDDVTTLRLIGANVWAWR